MPVIYLVCARDETPTDDFDRQLAKDYGGAITLGATRGPFIHETSFAFGGLRALVRDLITGQFKGPSATQPIERIWRIDTDAPSIEDASEAVLILIDAEAERLWIDELPPLLNRWRAEHTSRKAAAIAAPMKALTNLLASLTADPKAGITHGL